MEERQKINELDQLFQNERYDLIEPFILEQITNAKEKNDHASYISFSNELIGFYRSMEEYEKSLIISEDILLLMEELGLENSVHFGTTLLNAATAYRAAGKSLEALSYYERALTIYESELPHDDERFAGLYNNLSILLQQMGELEKSLLFLDNALRIIKKNMPESVETATSLTNKALLLFQLKRKEEATNCLEESLSLFQKLNQCEDPHYSAALSGLGEAYFHLGNYEKSVHAYEQAAELILKIFGKNQSYKIICYNCSVVCHEAGMIEKEMYYKNEAEGMD